MIDDTFASLGLNSPVTRFAAVFAATSGLIMAVKPTSMFNADGSAIGFSTSGEDGVLVTWWVPGLVLGGAAAMLF